MQPRSWLQRRETKFKYLWVIIASSVWVWIQRGLSHAQQLLGAGAEPGAWGCAACRRAAGLGQLVWVQHMGMWEGVQQGEHWARAPLVFVAAQGLQEMPGAQSRAGRAGLCEAQGMKSALGSYVAAELFPQALRLWDDKAPQQSRPGPPDTSGLGKGKTNQSLSRAQSREAQHKAFIACVDDLLQACPFEICILSVD